MLASVAVPVDVRKILRYLIQCAECGGSLRAPSGSGRSPRPSTSTARVSNALKRVQDQGWLMLMASGAPWIPATYHLHLPDVCKGKGAST